MTPCKRGVSDLGCGRGHDRRRGQISWSLTPRSPRWRGDDRGDGERSANTRRPRARDEKPPSHIYLQRPTEKREGRLARLRLAADISGRGNTPRWALFPSLFPLARRHVFGFASLRTGFAAAPNLRPGTSSAVMTPSFFSSRTSSLICLGNHHSGLTAACRSCHRSRPT